MNLTDTAEKIKTYDDLSYGGVLADEGIIADLSYSVNRLRRNAGLKITDRVKLFIYSGEIVSWAVYWNKSQLLKTTLSEEIFVNDVSLGNISVSLNCSPDDILIPEDAFLAKEVGASIVNDVSLGNTSVSLKYSPDDIFIFEDTFLAKEVGASIVNDVSLGNTSVNLNYSPGDILIPEDASLAKEVGTSIGGTQCDFPVYLRIEKI